MSGLSQVLNSSVGKKIISGLTGLGLVGFIIIHLAGNLAIFAGAEALNTYSHTLNSLGGGGFVYAAEAILVVVFLFHIVSGLQVARSRQTARPIAYQKSANAGHTSKKSSSSVSMIYTGLVLLVFTVFHLYSIKFGPSSAEGYVTVHNGTEMRDLYRLVVERFQNLFYVVGYVLVMALLGWHLRHGIWSALQSLGLTNKKILPVAYTLGGVLGLALAAGFLVMPIYIYIALEPN